MKKKKKIVSIMMLLVMIMTALPAGQNVSAREAEADIQAYSRGPEYVFSHRKSAEEQLNDLFTTLDLQDATISDLQREMERGNLTSEKLTQMYLDRINAYDKKLDLNSIIWINKNALSEARRYDKERASGKVRGKLHGIPIVVKDNYNVKGMPTSAGSVALSDLIAKEDCGTVRRLREAGAVIIAKANLSEFAWSAWDSHSTVGGDAHNAYNPANTPAGSSGGTATAVRSDFATAGLGTDTGGSIRNPSSFSNLFGIRPSKGLTSIDGVLPLEAPRDTTGPMAKTAEDLAIVLENMAGTEKKDDYTTEAKADTLLGSGYSKNLNKGSLKGKRIAFLTSSFDYNKPDVNSINQIINEEYGVADAFTEGDIPDSEVLDGEMEILTRAARANLKKAGAEFVDLSGKIRDEELFVYRFLNISNSKEYDINSFLSEYGSSSKIKTLKDILSSGKNIGYIGSYLGDSCNPDDLVDSFDKEAFADYGYAEYGDNKYIRTTDWEKVLTTRNRINKILEDEHIDAIMYIYFASPAFVQGNDEIAYNKSNYERVFGPTLGFPDINVPIGFISPINGTGSKLPVGMGLVGRYGGEKALMEIAYAYEKQAGETIRKTPAITPALRDEGLNSFLDALMEEACLYDSGKKNGAALSLSKVKKLKDAYNKALKADYDKPESVYKAAYELAIAYDKLVSADPKLTKAVKAKANLCYNGKPQELVTAGKASGGKVYYAVTEDGMISPKESAYSAPVPKKTKAGTYYIWYRIKGDAGHNDTVPKRIKVTVGKGIAVTLKRTSYTYDGREKKPAVRVDLNGKTLSSDRYSVIYSKGRRNAGTYKVTVKAAGKYTGSASFTINKAVNPLTVKLKKAITLESSDLARKEKTFAISKVLRILSKKTALTYSISSKDNIIINKKTGTITLPKGLKKGTYSVKVTVKAAAGANYKAATKSVSMRLKVT